MLIGKSARAVALSTSIAIGATSSAAFAVHQTPTPVTPYEQITGELADSTLVQKTEGRATSINTKELSRRLVLAMYSSHPEGGFLYLGQIFDRLGRVFRAWFGWMLKKAEDPRVMLDQAYVEMQEDTTKMRHAVARAMSAQKVAEFKAGKKLEQADEWQKKAEFAVLQGKDDLAKKALIRKNAFEASAKTMAAQANMQLATVEKLQQQLETMETKLIMAEAKIETLKATADAAQARLDAQAALDELQGGSFGVFDQFEEEVAKLEADADAMEEVYGQTVEQQFEDLYANHSLEDDLAALKAQMGQE